MISEGVAEALQGFGASGDKLMTCKAMFPCYLALTDKLPRSRYARSRLPKDHSLLVLATSEGGCDGTAKPRDVHRLALSLLRTTPARSILHLYSSPPLRPNPTPTPELTPDILTSCLARLARRDF